MGIEWPDDRPNGGRRSPADSGNNGTIIEKIIKAIVDCKKKGKS